MKVSKIICTIKNKGNVARVNSTNTRLTSGDIGQVKRGGTSSGGLTSYENNFERESEQIRDNPAGPISDGDVNIDKS